MIYTLCRKPSIGDPLLTVLCTMAALGGNETFEDAPPPYSPGSYVEPETRRGLPQTDHCSHSDHTFDFIRERIASERHSYNIRRNGDSINISIRELNDALFHVKVSEALNDTDLIMFQGEQGTDDTVAKARLPTHSRDHFEIYIGSQRSPRETDWTAVQCVKEGMLKSQSYHFQAGQRPMAWKRTHDTALGVSRIPHTGESYKLIDESDVGKRAPAHTHYSNAWGGMRVIAGGDVMAVYLAQAGQQNRRNVELQHGCGRIDWKEEFGEEVEIGALITLMAVLERNRRHSQRRVSSPA